MNIENIPRYNSPAITINKNLSLCNHFTFYCSILYINYVPVQQFQQILVLNLNVS